MELDLHSLLKNHVEMSLFAIIGVGYLLGKLGVGQIKLGSSIGVLFVALAFGHWGFTISPVVGTIGFVFFIYSVGYQAGPHFFQAFKQDGFRYIQIGVIIAVTAFVTALLGRSIFDMEPGYAAGVLAGGLTSTPTLAAAQDAARAEAVKAAKQMESAEQQKSHLQTRIALLEEQLSVKSAAHAHEIAEMRKEQDAATAQYQEAASEYGVCVERLQTQLKEAEELRAQDNAKLVAVKNIILPRPVWQNQPTNLAAPPHCPSGKVLETALQHYGTQLH